MGIVIDFILSGVFAVLIIGELRRIFKTVLNGNCFIMENVKSLRKMGTYSFFIAVITCCRLFSLSDSGSADRNPGLCDCRPFQQGPVPGI